jgi:ribosomal protein L11
VNIMAFCKEFNARTQGIKARHIVALCAVHCPSSRCRAVPSCLARMMFRCRCW